MVHLIISVIWVGSISSSWEIGCWLDQIGGQETGYLALERLQQGDPPGLREAAV